MMNNKLFKLPILIFFFLFPVTCFSQLPMDLGPELITLESLVQAHKARSGALKKRYQEFEKTIKAISLEKKETFNYDSIESELKNYKSGGDFLIKLATSIVSLKNLGSSVLNYEKRLIKDINVENLKNPFIREKIFSLQSDFASMTKRVVGKGIYIAGALINDASQLINGSDKIMITSLASQKERNDIIEGIKGELTSMRNKFSNFYIFFYGVKMVGEIPQSLGEEMYLKDIEKNEHICNEAFEKTKEHLSKNIIF